MEGRRKEGERPSFLNKDLSYDLLVPKTYRVGETEHRVDRVQLRRLTGMDMRILEEARPYTDRLFRIVSDMADLPIVVIEKLDAVDLDRIDDCLGYFREPGSVTGATS